MPAGENRHLQHDTRASCRPASREISLRSRARRGSGGGQPSVSVDVRGRESESLLTFGVLAAVGRCRGASFFCSHPEKAGALRAEQTTALRTAAAELEPFPGIACALRLRRGALRAGSGAEGVLPGLFPAVRRTTQAGRRFPVLSAQGRYAGLRVHCFGSAAERLRRSADARVIFSLSCAAAP